MKEIFQTETFPSEWTYNKRKQFKAFKFRNFPRLINLRICKYLLRMFVIK